MKEQLQQYLQEHLEEYKYLVNDLYEHPEIGNQEFRSMAVLCKHLRRECAEKALRLRRSMWYRQAFWQCGAVENPALS